MTNKDAIYILSGLKRSLNEYCGLNNNGQKAFDMAISALQEQEAKDSTESSLTQNGLDTISRQDAIDALMEIMDRPRHADFLYTDEICKTLNELPSAQPDRKHGEWTKEAHCPFCDFAPWYEKDIHTLSYCPNCGADLIAERRTDD